MRIASTVALLSVFSLAAMAQSERGNITGIATDQSGAAVAGAAISVTQRDTNAMVKTATSPNGEYNVPNLVPGAYRIEIVSAGFKRFIQQNLNVTAGRTVRVEPKVMELCVRLAESSGSVVLKSELLERGTSVGDSTAGEIGKLKRSRPLADGNSNGCRQ